MSLRHAILGLLAVEAMSGYNLKKQIDESVGLMWSADQSQVYRTLAGLVEDGLAARTSVVQETRPTMHIHAPTEAGLAELDDWLRSPLERERAREPFLLRLFFAGRLPIAEVRTLLRARRDEIAQVLAALEAVHPEDGAAGVDEVLKYATLSSGLAHARAEVAWVDDTLSRIDAVS